MLQEHFIELVDTCLSGAGASLEPGEEFASPSLEVSRYYRRSVRLSRIPFLGSALSVASVIRQPVDIDGARLGYQQLVKRVAMAVNGRFPPWRWLVIGLTVIVLTSEPIEPGDDAMLREVLALKMRGMRVVPFGLFRVNLVQEALAMAINSSPDRLFIEPEMLADLLAEHLRRYVPSLPQ
jgi:hypothetical protein